jgi:hypothetical protein
VTGATGLLYHVVRTSETPMTLPQRPRRQLSSILSTTEGGRSTGPPSLAAWPPLVTMTGRSGFHGDGLFPPESANPWIDMPDCLSHSGWVRRKLSSKELLTAADVPVAAQNRPFYRSGELTMGMLLRFPIGVLHLVGVELDSLMGSPEPDSEIGGLLGGIGGLLGGAGNALPNYGCLAGGGSVVSDTKRKFSGLREEEKGEKARSEGQQKVVKEREGRVFVPLEETTAVGGPGDTVIKEPAMTAIGGLRKEEEEEKEEKARSEGGQQKVVEEREGTVFEPLEETTVVEEPGDTVIKEPAMAGAPELPPVAVGLQKAALDAVGDAAKHAYAVATKADDAEVPTHLWDQRAL